ncbi:double zinc ribbon domain-containing protein [Roseomonas sp. GC11]|uniref:ComF family protein n=1 Tax=Roseomonas sp. GC11 TaxID=2950546 RepID=UPI00210F1AA8|nr:double zinc ribbon domain-containing protein [Roseomonas sp. GC11]MCQ4159543.1 double zinc ribbon domain-containing protein [Roseomonas sp. GC11]
MAGTAQPWFEAWGKTFRSGLRRLGHAALDLLLPPCCMACAAPVTRQGTLCAACFRQTPRIVAPLCHCCGVPFIHAGQGVTPHAPAGTPPGEVGGMPYATPRGALLCQRCLRAPPLYDRARAAYWYGEGSKRLILPLKYGDRTELAGPLARQMAQAGADLLAQAELLLPVPLHRLRLLARRYNQAALLARHLSRLSAVPWAPHLLRRPRRTAPLGEQGAAARAATVAGAFALAPGGAARIAGRRLLLVDDVLTTGATVSACAELLLRAGAAAVDVLAAARVPDPALLAEA